MRTSSASPAAALLAGVVALFGARAPAQAASAPEQAAVWLEGLYDRVAADLRAGKPLVVHAVVALCDNSVITCGGHGLGNGDDLHRNLYWATGNGMRGWFRRPGAGWTLAAELPGLREAVLATHVYRRTVQPTPAWRQHGVTDPFNVFVVAEAWRGASIEKAGDAYLKDLYRAQSLDVALPDGTLLRSGGAAHLVAYLGHNQWMDRPFEQPRDASAITKGSIMVACMTAQYLGGLIPGPDRVPLLMTHDFVFAGAHAFDGALQAFAGRASLDQIASAARDSYARGQRQNPNRLRKVFVNPSHRLWVPGRAAAASRASLRVEREVTEH